MEFYRIKEHKPSSNGQIVLVRVEINDNYEYDVCETRYSESDKQWYFDKDVGECYYSYYYESEIESWMPIEYLNDIIDV